MYIHCNTVVALKNLIDNIQGIGNMWFHPDRIANIVSLSRIKRRNCVRRFNSQLDNLFKMYKKDQTSYWAFPESDKKLYYSNLKQNAISLNMIKTIDDKKKQFSQLDHKHADRTRELHRTI